MKLQIPKQAQRILRGFSCSHDAISRFNATRSNDFSPLPFSFLMSAGTFGDCIDTAPCIGVSTPASKMGTETSASMLDWVEGGVERDHLRKQVVALGVCWNYRNSMIWYWCCSYLIDFSHLVSKPKAQLQVLGVPERTSKGSNHLQTHWQSAITSEQV